MPSQTEEWDDTYLATLGSQDIRQLRELLARSNPEVVMPLNGNSPLSQAVVLTLVHRVSASLVIVISFGFNVVSLAIRHRRRDPSVGRLLQVIPLVAATVRGCPQHKCMYTLDSLMRHTHRFDRIP